MHSTTAETGTNRERTGLTTFPAPALSPLTPVLTQTDAAMPAPRVMDPDALVQEIYRIVRNTPVTLNGDTLCSQSLLFAGNLSLLNLDAAGHYQPGRSRSQAELSAAHEEFCLTVARQVAARFSTNH